MKYAAVFCLLFIVSLIATTEAQEDHGDPEGCQDYSQSCSHWAENGDCETDPMYMSITCKKTCGLCIGGGGHHPCDKDNGGCDDKCERTTGTATCKCTKPGRVLGADGKSCDVGTCPSNSNATFGIVKSLNYPNNYPDDYECIAVITVPTGHQIHISIVDMGIEFADNCQYDYLEFIDGSTSSVIGTYCGTKKKVELTSENSVRIEFGTDRSVGGKGFFLEWKISA